MNVSTMAAINSINTMNLMMALQLEVNTIFVVNDGKEYEEMSEKMANEKYRLRSIFKWFYILQELETVNILLNELQQH